MNALDKIKNVQNGLKCCYSYANLCSACSYEDRRECKRELGRDALKNEVAKKTGQMVMMPSQFLVLTSITDFSVDGHDLTSVKLLIRTNDILCVYAGDEGSVIQLKIYENSIFKVKEKLEDILDMIAKGD